MQLTVTCSVVLPDGRVKFNVDPGAPPPRIVMLDVPDADRAAFVPGRRYVITIADA